MSSRIWTCTSTFVSQSVKEHLIKIVLLHFLVGLEHVLIIMNDTNSDLLITNCNYDIKHLTIMIESCKHLVIGDPPSYLPNKILIIIDIRKL